MTLGLELHGLDKSFEPETPVLQGIDLSIRRGEFVSLVGSSGCGKSTLLRIIAGLEQADGGRVAIDGREVTHLEPKARRIAMVFQSYALYPHMTVAANIATPLIMSRLHFLARLPLLGALAPGRRQVRSAIDRAVEEVADQLEIRPLLGRKPAQLSGGQRQRVALARAMVRQPSLFLMDEPLSNLDAKLRVHMRGELTDLHRRVGATFVYVTHDQVEAMTMSDRIALMERGTILQFGTPSELYSAPVNLRVAQFIGTPSINCFPAEIDSAGTVSCLGRPVSGMATSETRQQATLAVRPESIRLSARSEDVAFGATLRRIEHHGSEYILFTEPQGRDQLVRIRVAGAALEGQPLAEGQALTIGFSAADAHLFGSDERRMDVSLFDAPVRLQSA